MDTAQEALFRAMFTNDWMTRSSGDDDFGASFGYTTNYDHELEHILDTFADVIDAYGRPNDDDMIGSFFVNILSNGTVVVWKCGRKYAEEWFDESEEEYARYLNTTGF